MLRNICLADDRHPALLLARGHIFSPLRVSNRVGTILCMTLPMRYLIELYLAKFSNYRKGIGVPRKFNGMLSSNVQLVAGVLFSNNIQQLARWDYIRCHHCQPNPSHFHFNIVESASSTLMPQVMLQGEGQSTHRQHHKISTSIRQRGFKLQCSCLDPCVKSTEEVGGLNIQLQPVGDAG